MESGNHKGTELNNVQETWNQNEKNLQNGSSGAQGIEPDDSAPITDLDRLIKKEASEYDNTNKEARVLGGDRATVNDDEGETGAE